MLRERQTHLTHASAAPARATTAPASRARVGVLQAIRRYPMLAVVPMIVLAALGIAVGYARTPTYKSNSELAVGQLNVSDPAAVGSVVTATQSLASVYSRMIDATGVRQGIAKQIDPRGVQVYATPIPGSPLIRIQGVGHSAHRAMEAANAGAKSLLRYSKRYGASGTDSSGLYGQYKVASLRVAKLQSALGAIGSLYARDRSDANKRRLNAAQSDLDAARLKRDALRFQYGASRQSAQAAPVLREFTTAGGAVSDRVSYMEILGLLGLIAGGALGAALATYTLKRRVARLTGS